MVRWKKWCPTGCGKSVEYIREHKYFEPCKNRPKMFRKAIYYCSICKKYYIRANEENRVSSSELLFVEVQR